MRLGFRRAIVVGLGGTGVRALVHIKREFIKHFGEVPPVIRLVGFDTDNADNNETLQLEGRTVSLSNPEFMALNALKVRSLIDRTPEIAAWVPPADRMSMRDVVGGAGARRASGRVALFNNAHLVMERLRRAKDLVTAMQNVNFELGGHECEVVDPERTTVFFVGSLAGGTGSGMILDMAHLCRHMLGDLSNPIFGFLLLAGVYAHRPATAFVEANTYAALREIDHFMECSQPAEVRYPGIQASIPWGGDDHRPFDYVYLVDNENEGRLRINEIDPMLDFIARAIFLHMMVESRGKGSHMQSVFVNLSAILDALPPWREGPARYMGLGLSTFKLPVEEIALGATLETVVQLLDSTLIGGRENRDSGKSLARQVITDSALTGQAIMDQIRSSARTPDLKALAVKEARRQDPAVVTKWREAERTTIKNRSAELREKRNDAYRDLADRLQEIISSNVRDLLEGSGAVESADAFVNELQVIFRHERDELEQSIQKHRDSLKEIEVAYPDREAIVGAYSGTMRRTRLGRVLTRTFELLSTESQLSLEMACMRAAIELLAEALMQCDGHLKRLARLRDVLSKATTIARAEHRTARERTPLEDAFTIRLNEEYLLREVSGVRELFGPELVISALNAATEEEGTHQTPIIYRLATMQPDDLFKWLVDLVRPRFKVIHDMTIEDVLLERSTSDRGMERQENVIALAQSFVDKACPMWSISTPPGAKLEEIFIFGVPDTPRGVDGSALKTLIDEGRLELRGEGASGPGFHFATTWEQYNIRALKVKAAIPIAALERVVGEYRTKYKELEEHARYKYTAHIHKDWVGGEGLPDIVGQEEGESIADSSTSNPPSA